MSEDQRKEDQKKEDQKNKKRQRKQRQKRQKKQTMKKPKEEQGKQPDFMFQQQCVRVGVMEISVPGAPPTERHLLIEQTFLASFKQEALHMVP